MFHGNGKRLRIWLPSVLGSLALLITLACNLSASQLLHRATPTASLRAPAERHNKVTLTPTADLSLLMDTPAATPIILSVATPTVEPAPTRTVAPGKLPTATQLTSKQFQVQELPSGKGLYLAISGPGLPAGFRVGPVAKGAHAVGPNGRFLIYVSDSGGVFILHFGSPQFVQIANFKRKLISAQMRVEPQFEISFAQAEFALYLIIREQRFAQYFQLVLPRQLIY